MLLKDLHKQANAFPFQGLECLTVKFKTVFRDMIYYTFGVFLLLSYIQNFGR